MKKDITPTEFLLHLTEGALQCRNVRHAWVINTFKRVGNEEAAAQGLLKWDLAVSRRLECPRCETTRVEYFGRDNGMKHWVKVKNRYIYPQGYLWNGEEDAPTRWDYFNTLLAQV